MRVLLGIVRQMQVLFAKQKRNQVIQYCGRAGGANRCEAGDNRFMLENTAAKIDLSLLAADPIGKVSFVQFAIGSKFGPACQRGRECPNRKLRANLRSDRLQRGVFDEFYLPVGTGRVDAVE